MSNAFNAVEQNSMGSGIIGGDRNKALLFNTLADAEAWREENQDLLNAMHNEVRTIDAVQYTETWLCGTAPSFVAGFSDADEIIVCLRL